MDALGEPDYTGRYTLGNLPSSVPDEWSTLCRRNDRTIGVTLFLLAVLSWTVSGFITQILYRHGYEKPFLVTYAATGSYSLFLVPRLIQWLRKKPINSVGAVDEYESLVTTGGSNEELGETHGTSQHNSLILRERGGDAVPLSFRETVETAFTFCWLWFITNWATNASFNYTTVASSTVIASTSGFFALGMGVLFGVERFTLLKLMAVLISHYLSFLGVVLVSHSDSQQTSSTSDSLLIPITVSPEILFGLPISAPQRLLGDTLALISALFYAFYVVFFQVKVKTDSQIDMQLFLGFVGLFDLLTCWTVGMILNWTGVEKFEFPESAIQWSTLLAIMVILFLGNYLFCIAMLKTTPLLVTIGIGLTIPLAVLGDFFLSSSIVGQAVLGAVLVLTSFCLIALEDSGNNRISRG